MSPRSALEASMITSLETHHAGDFFSNDYLSIGKLPHIRQEFLNTLSQTPSLFGSTGSRAISGSTPHHIELEQYFKEQFEAEKAMIFNSGYICNLTFFGYAPQMGDVILYDEFVHASIHDGLRISRVKEHTFSFSHNSASDLESKLKRILKDYPAIPSGLSTLFIVIESVYSMEGDFSPMEELIALVEKYVPSRSAHIVVDEAHSLGLYGPAGKGLLREWRLEKRVHSVIFPFTKAVNFIGCVLTTTPTLYQYLSNYGRSWLFTTSLPHVDLAGIRFCFEAIQTQEADQLRKSVAKLSHLFLKMFLESTYDIPKEVLSILNQESKDLHGRGLVAPVFPIYTPQPLALQHYLNKLGYAARGLAHPGVPKGTERIRVVIHGGNTEVQIRQFVKSLRAWGLSQVSLTTTGQSSLVVGGPGTLHKL
ncbi:hypothetical protein EST38_g10306 [Candolleomyces aberdarensis]|uniref:Aminotransferase class I/classII large domain-containing protein n=1 Tax=Candolleomyces aberdarensis TaxID=2316362 RepID=A0A4Q2D7Q7_9AGAR|nr:hypothetical protein EST38_g10306 [Candolleomyces aberdarensis]